MFIVNRVSGTSLRTSLHCINFGAATDPVCGSGNFLTETYLSLRRLENDTLRPLNDQIMFDGVKKDDLIQVSTGQFYGIEINDFAVTVARTALWIAESQMMKATEEVVRMSLDFLPLILSIPQVSSEQRKNISMGVYECRSSL